MSRRFQLTRPTCELLEQRIVLTGGYDLQFDLAGSLQMTVGVVDVDIMPGGGYVTSSFAHLIRYLPDGTLDSSFGDAGVLEKHNEGSIRLQETIIQSNGRIVYQDPENEWLQRLAPDGTLDETFGERGRVYVKNLFPGLVRLPDDHMLVTTLADGSFSVLRLKANGEIDRRFGSDGYAHIVHPGYDNVSVRRFFGPNHLEQAVLPANDGAIIVQASARRFGEDVALLMRFTDDGRLDESFGDRGAVEMGFPGEMAVDQQGRIVVVSHIAHSNRADNGRLRIARFLPDGAVDSEFEPEIPPSNRELGYFSGVIQLVADSGGGFIVLGVTFSSWEINIQRFDHTGRFDRDFSQAVSQRANQLREIWVDRHLLAVDEKGDLFFFEPRGVQSEQNQIVKISRGSAIKSLDPAVDFRLTATDLQGNQLSQVMVGDQFRVEAYVSDLRNDAEGVFAAYADLLVSEGDVSFVHELQFADAFPNGRSGHVHTTYLDEVGAFGELASSQLREQLLFSFTMRADSVGPVRLHLDPADESPIHNVLLHGRSDRPVSPGEVTYGTLEIESMPVKWHNSTNQFDVDSNGVGSAIDALAVINYINQEGARLLPEQHSGQRMYLDVNNDKYVSAVDVLLIVDMLNRSHTGGIQGGWPEGEADHTVGAHDDRVHSRPAAENRLKQMNAECVPRGIDDYARNGDEDGDDVKFLP